MLTPEQAVLAVVDVQGKLADLMYERALLCANLDRLVRGVRALGVPILWTEQNPRRMGPTIPALRERLAPLQPIPKMHFSCCGEPAFVEALRGGGRRQVLLAGIEAHICVYQTAADLVGAGYEVWVVSDAVSSRAAANRDAGLAAAAARGARLASVEMVLFEMMRTADHPAFREILGIVK